MNLPKRNGGHQRHDGMSSSNTSVHSSTFSLSVVSTSSFDSQSTQSSVQSIVSMFQAEAARRREKTRKLRRKHQKILERFQEQSDSMSIVCATDSSSSHSKQP